MHYCYSCNRNVDSTIKMVRESCKTPSGQYLTMTQVMRICDRCGKEIPDNKINDAKVRRAFTDYQKKILNIE